MSTDLDVNTLFMVTMHVEIMLGLLLFFAWAQNFSKTALAWWGSSHLLRAVSIMLFGMHGSIPAWASIDLANAALFASFALTWSGARVFDRRRAEPVWCMVGVVIWLLACRLPQFAASIELRALVGSFIVTTYTWLAAYEFWRGRDEALVSRWPAIFMLFAHGALFLLRTPLGVMFHISPANAFSQSAWLELLSLEALLFTISIAFILLAMAKERTEFASPRGGAHRRADRHLQPPRLPGAGARRTAGPWTQADRRAADRPRQLQERSTTASATPSATGCCRSLPKAPRPTCRRKDWSAAGAATSSSPCSTTPDARRRRRRRSGCRARSKGWPPTSTAIR